MTRQPLPLLPVLIGFLFVLVAGFVFKDLVIKKYITNAPEIITYYQWIFPLGFGLLIFTLLEAWAWQIHKSIFTNFLKELGWRLFTTVLIVFFAFKLISFDLFIKLFSFSYPFIAMVLLFYLLYTRQIHFHFRISKADPSFFREYSETVLVCLCGTDYFQYITGI
jgi:hypothetical protein